MGTELIAIAGDFHPDSGGVCSQDIAIAHELDDAIGVHDLDLIIVSLYDYMLAFVVVVVDFYLGVVLGVDDHVCS